MNIIQLDDPTIAPLFAQGFDSCLEIDQINPIPGINWYYDGTTYWSPVTLALVNNNFVVNIIQNYTPYVSANPDSYQYVIDITNSIFPPSIGWGYDGTNFIPDLAYYQDLLSQATIFGNQLVNLFAATNASNGIAAAGKTGAVLSYTSNLYLAMSTGSLYLAISIIDGMIADTSATKTNLAPFITNDILYSYLNQIQTWLEIPLTPNPGP